MSLDSIKEKSLNFIDIAKAKSQEIIQNTKSALTPRDEIGTRPKARNISKSLEFASDNTKNRRNVPSHLNKKSNAINFQSGIRSKNSKDFDKDSNSVKLSGRKKLLFYIGALVVAPILVIAIGFYTFLSFSSLYTATIRYEYKNVSEVREITASSTSPEFTVTKLESTDSVSSFQNTTGEKVIGEKATGRITIFNATPEIKVVKKGTTITCVSSACNGLVYVSVNDLNLGPGNSINDYEIVASDIGENYNLQVNAGRFKVANFKSDTEIVASNIAAITGGTPKKTVKVVSAEDIKAVEAKAMDDLKTILLNNIKSQSNNLNNYIISDLTFVSEKISAETDKEGTEAEVVNTSVKAKGTVDAFPKTKIQEVINEIKNSLAPEGYYLDEKFFNSSTEVINSAPGTITVKVSVNSIIRPEINLSELKKQLAGKNLSEADKILSEIPNSKSYSYDYSPSLMPGFLRRVPGDTDRIDLRLVALVPEN